MSEEIIAGVQAALVDWDELPTLPGFCRDLGDGWLVGGLYKGVQYVKHTAMAPDGVDTPDDPIAAAVWLDAHAKARCAPVAETAIIMEDANHDLAANPASETDASVTLQDVPGEPGGDAVEVPEPVESDPGGGDAEGAASGEGLTLLAEAGEAEEIPQDEPRPADVLSGSAMGQRDPSPSVAAEGEFVHHPGSPRPEESASTEVAYDPQSSESEIRLAADGEASNAQPTPSSTENTLDETYVTSVLTEDREIQPEAYPGIAITRNELEDLRNDVFGLISRAEIVRLQAFNDPSWAQDYKEAILTYTNWPEGAEMSDQVRLNYERYTGERKAEQDIKDHATALKRAAIDAPRDALEAMAANVDAGWP